MKSVIFSVQNSQNVLKMKKRAVSAMWRTSLEPEKVCHAYRLMLLQDHSQSQTLQTGACDICDISKITSRKKKVKTC